MEKNVSITENEYNSLVEDSVFLYALEQAGVDNWEGYQEAARIFYEIIKYEEDYKNETTSDNATDRA